MNARTVAPNDFGAWNIKAARQPVHSRRRPAEIVIATLFLVTAATGFYGVAVLDPILGAPDYLAGVFPSRRGIVLGAVLLSITNIGIVFIAVFAFPLLRKLDETLAVAYLTIRIIGGSVMMFGIAATLALIPLSETFIEAGSPAGTSYRSVGDALLHLKLLGLTELSLPLLGLGGTIFCWQLFRFRLVPALISVPGFSGYALICFGGIAGWLGLVDSAPFGPGTFLTIPVAIFEIILLPFWLLSDGFKMPTAATN